jgi:hypothetical protein
LPFPEEQPKQLDQDEIIEIQNQVRSLAWHETMVNANIDIFEMYYEESVSYFKRSENLKKIKRTNGPNPFSLPIGSKKRVSVTNSVGKSSENHKWSNIWCVTIVTRITTTRLNAEQLPNLNSRKITRLL